MNNDFMHALYLYYNTLSSTFLRHLKNNFKYFLSVTSSFLSPFSLGFSAIDECVFVLFSSPKSQLWFFFPCGGLICHVSTASFHNIVSLSWWFYPLKSFISLKFLYCNLFWALSLPVLSEHFTLRYCWDGLLGDFLVASGVSLCFPNWRKSNH